MEQGGNFTGSRRRRNQQSFIGSSATIGRCARLLGRRREAIDLAAIRGLGRRAPIRLRSPGRRGLYRRSSRRDLRPSPATARTHRPFSRRVGSSAQAQGGRGTRTRSATRGRPANVDRSPGRILAVEVDPLPRRPCLEQSAVGGVWREGRRPAGSRGYLAAEQGGTVRPRRLPAAAAAEGCDEEKVPSSSVISLAGTSTSPAV